MINAAANSSAVASGDQVVVDVEDVKVTDEPAPEPETEPELEPQPELEPEPEVMAEGEVLQ